MRSCKFSSKPLKPLRPFLTATLLLERRGAAPNNCHSYKMAKGKAIQGKGAGGLQESLATARTVAWKLVKSTGKAGWITATTCLVLLVPLIIEMDREQQLVEFENQQLGALTGGAPGPK